MKFSLYYLMLFVIVLSACKKDDQKKKEVDAQLHQVTFHVPGFSQQLTVFDVNKSSKKTYSAATDTLKAHAGVIYCIIYDATGKIINSIKQDSTNSNFGTIVSNLPAGNYTAGIAAGHANLRLVGNFLLQTVSQDSRNVSFQIDAFYKKIPITVTNADVTYPVTLSRIVGQLQINIADALPANATNLTFRIKDYYGYRFDTFNGVPTVALLRTLQSDPYYTYSQQINSSEWGTTNHKLNLFILNTTTPFTVSLSCAGSEVVIPNVTCQQNQLTILTGNLFGGNSGTGSNVAVDTTWHATTTVHF